MLAFLFQFKANMKVAQIALLLASALPFTMAWFDPYYQHILDSRDADPYYDDIELEPRDADYDYNALYDRSDYMDYDLGFVERDAEPEIYDSVHYRRGPTDPKKIAKDIPKVTLGPKGRNVVIDKSFGAPRIT